MLQEHYQVGAAHGAGGQGGVGDEPEVAPAR